MARVINCDVCGVEVIARSGSQRYCAACVRERKRERAREYWQRPEAKKRKLERQREYNQRPEVKERRQRPEVKERDRKRQREYYQRPEVKERDREYQREWHRKNRIAADTDAIIYAMNELTKEQS